ncbi:SDR family NAD(P)-dependent oxidoreductase [Ilumatobacter coccineus]|jgi:NAD(P)-dependent dehydrogenase (short-subunit alcohol dehydrogenase family)|uniref:Putative oxidoreductase n=1 Tax=Ilumatobacter coccineus (strain NBRC 103263 / KCTC 29153 / YM16-304) TaxID=1313172 RepID=A0A6C7EDZ3_ILUCY|nr:SDR family oxidoreductase [Ilumatobacter coccineus]BAN03379.1 putative oxidoreductase [Ilumatobacter coccineus YM16-304]
MADRYADKVAVITGGASGLGEATTRLLVQEGGRVVIADYGTERGEALAAELGDAVVFAQCDVTDEAQVAAAFDLGVSTFGRMDGAFANAGIVGAAGPIESTPMDDFDKTMAVLVRGVFATTKHAARTMIAAGNGGSIAMTSSVAGVQGGLGPHAYAMAKAGVIGLARSAAAELQANEIRVNAIAPGSIPTAMTAHVTTGDPDDVAAIENRLDKAPLLGRRSTPYDIAEAVLFFFSEAGSWITGQTLVVDGGQTAAPAMAATWSSNRMVVAR